MREHKPRWRARTRVVALAGSVTLAGGLSVAAVSAPGYAAAGQRHAAATADRGCRLDLGNGVKHVISIVFDNVHFSRDNPNVPSDLEQMPHLLNFLKSNGTVLSNMHTPMIAHTADDSLTIYTGLYGDRHGQPLSNSYKTYNPNGTTDPASSFAYWTPRSSTPRTRRPLGTTRHRAWSTPTRFRPRGARPTSRRPPRGCRSPAPAARSATSPQPTWCWRTTRDLPDGVRPGSPEVGPGSTPTRTRSRTPRSRTTSASAVHCAGAAHLRERPG